MTNLDPDLQRILNVNAKVYNTTSKRQGKVISVSSDLVIVDYGNKAKSDTEEYDIDDFSQMLVTDEIVANSRLTMDSKDNFKIKPRQASHGDMKVPISENLRKPAETPILTPDVKSKPSPEVKEPCITNRQPAEIGYINFPSGSFSKEPKKGYTKVEFRRVIEKVTLELTSEQLDQLRELGIVK